MKLFVLTGCIAYEDREVLGVYNSIEEAKYQADEVSRESAGGYHYFEVSVHKLGGEAMSMEVVERWNDEDLVD